MDRAKWQAVFDEVVPEGARVEFSDRPWFHVPRIVVYDVSDKYLDIVLWQMDANGNLPLLVQIEPPSELAGPVFKLQAKTPDLPPELTVRVGLPPLLRAELPEWQVGMEEINDAS